MFWNLFNNQTTTQIDEASYATSSVTDSVKNYTQLLWDSTLSGASWAGFGLWSAAKTTAQWALYGGQYALKYANNFSYAIKLFKNSNNRHLSLDNLAAQLSEPNKDSKVINQKLIGFCQSLAQHGYLFKKLNQEQQRLIKRLNKQSKGAQFHISHLNEAELNLLAQMYEALDSRLSIDDLELSHVDFYTNECKKNIATSVMANAQYAAYAPTLLALSHGFQQSYKHWHQGNYVHAKEALLNTTKQAAFSIPATLAWQMTFGEIGIVGGISLQVLSSKKWYNQLWDPKKTLEPQKYQWLNDYFKHLSLGDLNQALVIASNLEKHYGIDVEDEQLLALVEDVNLATIRNKYFTSLIEGALASKQPLTRDYLISLEHHFQSDFTKPYVVDAVLNQMKNSHNTQGHQLVTRLGEKLGSYQATPFTHLFKGLSQSHKKEESQYHETSQPRMLPHK